jgi:hypothetical protein
VAFLGMMLFPRDLHRDGGVYVLRVLKEIAFCFLTDIKDTFTCFMLSRWFLLKERRRMVSL